MNGITYRSFRFITLTKPYIMPINRNFFICFVFVTLTYLFVGVFNDEPLWSGYTLFTKYRPTNQFFFSPKDGERFEEFVISQHYESEQGDNATVLSKTNPLIPLLLIGFSLYFLCAGIYQSIRKYNQ